MVGIVGYGVYIPRYRIKTEDIAEVWGEDGEKMASGLGVYEKSLPGPDEDVATISVEAARNAIKHGRVDPTDIGAIYVGSESHPYAVKPTGTIVAEAVGCSPNMTAADFEFACKAGTAAIQTCMGLVKSDMIKIGLAIGSDTAQGRPGDALEYSAAAGGAAYLIGEKDVLATIEDTASFTTDTPDFWRREGEDYPSHGARFTGKPAYYRHVMEGANLLWEKTGTTVDDYDHFVFHMPNGKFPVSVARKLGVPMEKLEESLVVRQIGNTYSGSAMIGLARILDIAEPNDRIFMVSYGSGAGSDAFDIRVEEEITERRGEVPTVDDYITRKTYVNYAIYAKYRRKIKSLE
ncbi:MAG: hydroxymethylglutaryl-CoA synthase [Candidatus Lokiarchaeota archaeon]|jgi:hydroxymethylglutaryl-CoA synthase|nr:hydroxymethylglutaryl-CoA synthase [Candidatus Lokiarchaeota archaeon]